ncbi:hypothetical protein ACUHZR_20515, partial [Photobacterium damselae subsp. piscicida]
MGNENLDESGLETCLVNAGNAAKSQVYDLSAQGDKLTSQVEQECAHLKKVTADDADGTKAKVKWVVTPIDLLMVKFTFYKRSNNLIVHLFAFR